MSGADFDPGAIHEEARQAGFSDDSADAIVAMRELEVVIAAVKEAVAQLDTGDSAGAAARLRRIVEDHG